MSRHSGALARAEAQVAAVRDDPAARLALLARTYHGPTGSAPRHLPFRRAALSFMSWQADRGLLNPLDASPPGSRWWRAVNERLLQDGCESVALSGGVVGDPSSRAVRLWLQFISRPTGRNWYRAHNASIVGAYLEHRELAEAETAAERFFMNVALLRVLYAHALNAAPRLALGRFHLLGRLLGDPRLGWPEHSSHSAACSQTAIRSAKTSAAISPSSTVSAECSTMRLSCRGCSACTSGPPRRFASPACSTWFATATRSTPGHTSSDTFGAPPTCHSQGASSNAPPGRDEPEAVTLAD
jgi:hypothetical protein